jgi:hypothetical protein
MEYTYPDTKFSTRAVIDGNTVLLSVCELGIFKTVTKAE